MLIKNTRWIIECIAMFTYAMILEFVFMPTYLTVFSYMLGTSYKLSASRFLISLGLLLLVNIFLYEQNENENRIYSFSIRIFMLTYFVPMLVMYSCSSTLKTDSIIVPGVFGILLFIALKRYEKNELRRSWSILIKPIKNADLYVLVICGLIAIGTWAIAGFPIVGSVAATYDQRMSLREQSLPTIINYLYTMTGGALLPYLFARNLINRKYFRMVLSLLFGVLLFFVNGMKTWFLLYIFAVVIVLLYRRFKNFFSLNLVIEIGFIFISIITSVLFVRFSSIDLLGQFGRIVVIPNNIGFKYVEFFKENELLYLRESIFRLFADSPYPGGSDFFVNYGTSSTLTSSRSNNGLFGDAFRNFGYVGMIVYPFLIAKVFNLIERNSRNEDTGLRFFLIFLLAWGTINASFFTWLLTGGVIVLFILLKIYQANAKYIQLNDEYTV